MILKLASLNSAKLKQKLKQVYEENQLLKQKEFIFSLF